MSTPAAADVAIGVFGQAYANEATDTVYGVYGRISGVAGSTRWAGYFEYNVGIQGRLSTNTRTVSANSTLAANDSVLFVNAATGPRTVTLPTAVAISGAQYTIKKIDSSANGVTVDGVGAETIDGAATYVLTLQWRYVILVSDGANWMVVGN
jgi:hypothetical protein